MHLHWTNHQEMLWSGFLNGNKQIRKLLQMKFTLVIFISAAVWCLFSCINSPWSCDIKTTDSWSTSHYAKLCETLDPGIHLDATWHNPSAPNTLKTKQSSCGTFTPWWQRVPQHPAVTWAAIRAHQVDQAANFPISQDSPLRPQPVTHSTQKISQQHSGATHHCYHRYPPSVFWEFLRRQ